MDKTNCCAVFDGVLTDDPAVYGTHDICKQHAARVGDYAISIGSAAHRPTIWVGHNHAHECHEHRSRNYHSGKFDPVCGESGGEINVCKKIKCHLHLAVKCGTIL